MQEQDDLQKDAKEAHAKFQPIENGEDEDGSPIEAGTTTTTKTTSATDAAVNVKTESNNNAKKENELPSPVSDNTVKNDINTTTTNKVEAAAC